MEKTPLDNDGRITNAIKNLLGLGGLFNSLDNDKLSFSCPPKEAIKKLNKIIRKVKNEKKGLELSIKELEKLCSQKQRMIDNFEKNKTYQEVAEAREQFKNGDTLTHDEVWGEAKEPKKS